MLRKVPVIVILGSTGTGKTKLSLELAERYGGEIISADSMQVYANLNIVTAKATKEEQSRAKHHLLDVATPSIPYTVVNFRNSALPIIEKLLAQKKCPIIVGGTNYYIESLLWDNLVSPMSSTELYDVGRKLTAEASKSTTAPTKITLTENDATVSENSKNRIYLSQTEMTTMSSELLHNHLKKIDSIAANRMHPNNKRKIMRAIEVYQQTGQTLTSKLQEQRLKPGANRLGGPLRYPHTILLWLRCNQDVLNERLEKRVNGMLQQGLLREIRAFQHQHCGQSDKSETVYTKGILQTIGFKEFIPYLQKFDVANDEKIEKYLQKNDYEMPATSALLKAKTKSSVKVSERSLESNLIDLPEGLEILNECLNELKLVTRRYSKKQIKWINNRFLGSKDRQVPDIFELDTSDVTLWHGNVFQRATQIIDSYRSNQVCDIQPMAKYQHPGDGLEEETSNFCVICERHFIGQLQWQLHLKSNKHKKRKESLNKKKLKKRPKEEALKMDS